VSIGNDVLPIMIATQKCCFQTVNLFTSDQELFGGAGWSLLSNGRCETKPTASFMTLTGVTVEWLCPTLSGP
jgi:hypothetical protein